MDKYRKYLNILALLAADSEPHAGQRVAACIVYNNRIVSFGFNTKKSDPFAVKFQKNPQAIYLHAETAAIKRALRVVPVEKLKHSTLYVCRVSNKDDSWALAKPCIGCHKAIVEFGIQMMVYTVEHGKYEIVEKGKL
jgi:tRNA(Arg) A34 adenosine deaminase TadA